MEQVKDILSQRGSRYGEFRDNARVSQVLKDVVAFELQYLEKDIPSWADEALDNIFQKIARIIVGDPLYDDNWADIAGYASLARDCAKEDLNAKTTNLELSD